MKKLVIFFIILLVTNISTSGITPVELLPEDNEIPGWTHDPDSMCWEGVATDCTSLYYIIDGGAHVYLDRGYVSSAYRGYTDGVEVICLEIYDQTIYENAISVYHALGDSIFTFISINSLSDSARIDTSFLYVYVLELANDNFFMRFSCPKDDQYKQTMLNMAHNIVGKVSIKEYPDKKTLLLLNNPAKISIHPINSGFVFKITMNSISDEKLHAPEIFIYNSKGILIRKLFIQQFGTLCCTAAWDGKNQAGVQVANGLYSVSFRKNNILISQNFMVRQ